MSLPTSRDSIQSKMDSILEKIGYNGSVQLSDGYKIIQMKDGMGVESSADIYLAWTDHTVIENSFDSEKIAKSVLVSALCKDNEKISLFSAFLDYIISGRSWETVLTLTEDGELTDDMIKSLRYGPSLQMELYPAKFALAQRENPEFYKEIVAYVTGDSQEKPMDFLDRISNFNEVIARGAAQ